MHRPSLVVIGALALVTILSSSAAADQAGKGKAAAARPAAPTAATPVNLNTATAAQLETLPGIGPRAAERILEYRQKNGSFKKIEELMNVKGIGEKSFLKLKPLIVVSSAPGEPAAAK
jgi:competence protein ComEA